MHKREGIGFRLGEEVVTVEGQHRVERVRLRGGEQVEADIVVAGLGVEPASGMVRGVELSDDSGLPVDANLQAADGLFAAGDIAAFSLDGDDKTVRVECWRVAEQHGRVAALNMLGRTIPYDAVPYFSTIHYMKRLDYVGHADHWDEIVLDGDLHEPRFAAFYIEKGMVSAVAGWGGDRQMAACIGLMMDRKQWSAAEFRAALAP